MLVQSFVFLSIALWCVSVAEADLPSYQVGDIRYCQTTQLGDASKLLKQIDVLPGLGFDALRSLDLGQVYNYNFSNCRISSDGLYLLPNDINLIPILHSQVDMSAEVYDHYSQYKSEVSHSLNVQAKVEYDDINTKFSMSYQKMKSKAVNDQSRSTRIGIRHHLYTVDINPDAQLNPSFKSRVFDIAANIQNGNTKLAHYLAELLVRDYGTHVVTSIDAGAILSQTTFFQDHTETDQQSTRLNISASASATFYSMLKLKVSYSFASSDDDIKKFQNQRTSSYSTTHGGPYFKLGNFTYIDWEDGILDHLAAIDRRGKSLHSVLNPATIPEFPPLVLAKTSQYVYKAIAKYYKVNTHTGCTMYNPLSPNFNFHANVDDGSCKKLQINYTFGGVYQTCTNLDDYDVCGSMNSAQTNPLTSDYSCPDHYEAILLHSGTLKKLASYKHRHCHSGFWHKKCKTDTLYSSKSAQYDAYWCALPPNQQPTQTGLFFGGVYTSTRSNVLTGQTSCPRYYIPLNFGEDMTVCVSSDTEGSTDSLKFGGFYSCSAGNPMAATKAQDTYPKVCPNHYSQLMVAVDEDCIVNVCTDIRQVLQFEPQPPVLPPFRHSFNLLSNTSEVLMLTDMNGDIWVKLSNGQWEKSADNQGFTTGQQLLGILLPVNDNASANDTGINDIGINDASSYSVGKDQLELSGGEVAGIVIGSVVGTLSVVAFVGVGLRKIRNRRKSTYSSSSHEELHCINN